VNQRQPITQSPPDAPPVPRTTRFRQLLASPATEFLLEAHNGISARIAEEAGFRGLWASGLSLSAQFGVRDSNEASWTQILEMVEFMAEATTVPIMLDGDTGYGNFNNMRRLVRKLEQRGVAAVCIEDKLFPKANSFIEGRRQPLADTDEFAGKIMAGKDAQRDDDFSIVARVEALIAGAGMREALRRAEAYRAAGADAILIHSALSVADEVLEFMHEWGDRAPVVIVPTRYYATPTDVFRDAGCAMVIWANHLLRAAVRAMQDTAAQLAGHQNLLSVEDRIAPVEEIFRLQGAGELKRAEARYLPPSRPAPQALILAASRGAALGELTRTRPKTMVEVGGRPLLDHIADTYRGAGIRDLTVVRGFARERVNLADLHYVDNEDWDETGEVVSLGRGLATLDEGRDLVVSYGDVLFNRYILQILDLPDEDFVIVADTDWRDSVNRDRAADYLRCSEPHSRAAFYHRVLLEDAGEDLAPAQIHAEWMGFLRVSAAAVPRLLACVAALLEGPGGSACKLHHVLAALVGEGEAVRVVYTTGHWLDVDTVDDLLAAGGFGA
jgi:phosphoenolpyruvate phosphomutase